MNMDIFILAVIISIIAIVTINVVRPRHRLFYITVLIAPVIYFGFVSPGTLNSLIQQAGVTDVNSIHDMKNPIQTQENRTQEEIDNLYRNQEATKVNTTRLNITNTFKTSDLLDTSDLIK